MKIIRVRCIPSTQSIRKSLGTPATRPCAISPPRRTAPPCCWAAVRCCPCLRRRTPQASRGSGVLPADLPKRAGKAGPCSGASTISAMSPACCSAAPTAWAMPTSPTRPACTAPRSRRRSAPATSASSPRAARCCWRSATPTAWPGSPASFPPATKRPSGSPTTWTIWSTTTPRM